MMRITPGQAIEEFEADGKRIVFRTLKRGDERGSLSHINALINERAYIYWQRPFTLRQERKWVEDNLKENRAGTKITIIIEADGKIIGTATVWKEPFDATRHVAHLAIGLSSERGRGIGRRLMETLERLAADNLKARMIELGVYEHNTIAKKLYEDCGFREAGRIPGGLNHYGKYMDEITLVKDLCK